MVVRLCGGVVVLFLFIVSTCLPYFHQTLNFLLHGFCVWMCGMGLRVCVCVAVMRRRVWNANDEKHKIERKEEEKNVITVSVHEWTNGRTATVCSNADDEKTTRILSECLRKHKRRPRSCQISVLQHTLLFTTHRRCLRAYVFGKHVRVCDKVESVNEVVGNVG